MLFQKDIIKNHLATLTAEQKAGAKAYANMLDKKILEVQCKP